MELVLMGLFEVAGVFWRCFELGRLLICAYFL